MSLPRPIAAITARFVWSVTRCVSVAPYVNEVVIPPRGKD
jgi:hypothetical protein